MTARVSSVILAVPAIYLVLVAVIAALLSRWRPTWMRWRVITISSVPGPALLLIVLSLGFVGSFLDQPLANDSAGIDARYHAMGAYLALAIAIPILLAMGAIISWLAVALLKR